ncbi:MAG: hypothetical protein FJY55_08110 [Betaproteobacteria bacterium]|nr:hypothetical protein [Betaproteobacteria bacterium]
MTTSVLENAVNVPKHSFPWQAMLAFLTKPESGTGALLLQRNNLGADPTAEFATDTLLGVIGCQGVTHARIHKLADQDEPDSK